MIWSAAYTKIAVGVMVVGLGALGLSEYTAHVKADATMQATITAQAIYQKQITSQMVEIQKQANEREASYQLQLASLKQQWQSAVTPQQIAAIVQQVMKLNAPIQFVTPPATPANPNPTPVAQIPSEDAPQVKAYVQECETCKLQVPKLQADLADREAQMALAQKQIDSLKAERDAAVKAEKGGSWLQRVGRAGKYLLIGAGAGAALLCGSGHCK